MDSHKGELSSAGSDSDSSSASSSSSSSSDSFEVPSKKLKASIKKKYKKKKKEKKKKEEKIKLKKKNRLTKNDYYNKNAEFSLWLSEEKKKDFEDLTSKQAKKLFKKFVEKWNKKKLSKKYYRGIDSYLTKASSRTKYRWGFSTGSVSELELSRDKISQWNTSFATFGKEPEHQAGKAKPQPAPSVSHTPKKNTRMIGPTMIGPLPPPTSQVDEEEQRDVENMLRKKELKDFRKYNTMVIDELLPKATGHEAKIEKKIARAQDRRMREISPEMGESALMGGNDDFQARMQSRKRHMDAKRESRSQAAVGKIAAYQEKEQAKMKALLEMARATKGPDALW